jgi:hypothetical protein
MVSDRAEPLYLALVIPLLGVAGALLVFVRDKWANIVRVVLALFGVIATALTVRIGGSELGTDLTAFGSEVTVRWLGEIRPRVDSGALALYVLFLVPLAYEVVVQSARAIGRARGEPR